MEFQHEQGKRFLIIQKFLTNGTDPHYDILPETYSLEDRVAVLDLKDFKVESVPVKKLRLFWVQPMICNPVEYYSSEKVLKVYSYWFRDLAYYYTNNSGYITSLTSSDGVEITISFGEGYSSHLKVGKYECGLLTHKEQPYVYYFDHNQKRPLIKLKHPINSEKCRIMYAYREADTLIINAVISLTFLTDSFLLSLVYDLKSGDFIGHHFYKKPLGNYTLCNEASDLPKLSKSIVRGW